MKITKLMTFAVAGLLILTIVVGIQASSYGVKLLKLEDKAIQLENTNQELKDNILSAQSLTQIEKKAKDAGMEKPETFIYMNNQGIALR